VLVLVLVASACGGSSAKNSAGNSGQGGATPGGTGGLTAAGMGGAPSAGGSSGEGALGGAPSSGGSAGSTSARGGSAGENAAGSDPVGGSSAGDSSAAGSPAAGSSAGGASAGGGSAGSGGAGTVEGIVLGRIRVSAGELDRDHSIVTFPPPFADAQTKHLVLDDGAGNLIPLQLNPVTGVLAFILPSLGVGEQAEYTILELPDALPERATALTEGDHLFLRVEEEQVLRWTLVVDDAGSADENDARAGYIYPLYTPAGLNVSDDYPVDHPSNHGIWAAWLRTSFRGHLVDFYNGFSDSGRVDLDRMDGIWSGPVHAGLAAHLVHTDITTSPPVVALTDDWTVTVYATHEGTPPYFVFDIESTQLAATQDPLILEQNNSGGFTFRGANAWQDPSLVSFLTSEGDDRDVGDAATARWVSQFGSIGGERGGYAALDHPDNFRHPQGLFIHPTNPFFSFVPVTAVKGGRFTIEVGTPYVTRFRVVTFDGDADGAVLERLWGDYAEPAGVEVLP